MNTINQFATKMPVLTGTDSTKKREELKSYFNQTWSLYESLFKLINNDDAYFSRPEPLRHPLIFYFGHTATFYINKLILGKFINQRVDTHIESICAVGVDEMSWDDLNTENYAWPTVDEVKQYRVEVNKLVNQLIDTMPLELPIAQDSVAWVILMGIEHERIHVETSSVIMRMLPLEDLTANPIWAACPYTDSATPNHLKPVVSQTITLGKPQTDETYGWDNEYGEKIVDVAAFNASTQLVSNAEFMAFVDAGGYQNIDYWTPEGQSWLSYTKALMPRFWQKRGEQYYQRNLTEVVKLPQDWPVEVNYLEAKAFCQWKSEQTNSHIRLPTEPEWACLRENIAPNLPHWSEAPGNINLEYFASPCPVNKFDSNGFFDVIGNVWQWTESPFDGFSGFKVHPLYDDFSTPTFDGQHNLIKGGSWISTGNEAQKHSRYAFRRHFYQHAGFRYVQSDSAKVPIETVNQFEQNAVVAQQLEHNFGDLCSTNTTPSTLLPFGSENYQVRCIKSMFASIGQTSANQNSCNNSLASKVLNLGCSVGRSAFELAKHCDHIDAIDFTARNIQHAFVLQEQGETRYTLKHEGEVVDFKDINIKQTDYWQCKDKINFSQGDACNLKPIYQDYDLVVALNLLEQLYDPELFLSHIVERMKQQSYLVLASNYDFNQQDKNKQQFLGGVKVNGENYLSEEGLLQLLSSNFELVSTTDILSLTTKSARQYEVDNNQLTIWKRI